MRVRSDVERKRLMGIAVTDHEHIGINSGLYDATTTRRTYEHLMRTATVIVDAGFPAIVDATFLHHADRQMFRELAERLGAQPTIVVCEAPTRHITRTRRSARCARHRCIGRDAGSTGTSAPCCIRDAGRGREVDREVDRYEYRAPDAFGALRGACSDPRAMKDCRA